MITPAFTENNIPVVFATGDSYALYLSVAIKSLIENSSPNNNYDILILDTGMNSQTKEILLSLSDKNNISIRIIDTAKYLNNPLLRGSGYITATTYMRIFIPEIFTQYEKVVYLDCDVIVIYDVAELYNTDIGQFSIGGSPTHSWKLLMKADDEYANYTKNVLQLKNKPANAGVLIINISAWNNKNLVHRCLELMANGIAQRWLDNSVMAVVCDGDTYYIEYDWNMCSYFLEYNYELSDIDKEEYKSFFASAKILHYAGSIKPWNNPRKEYSDVWWNYAKKLDHYDVILEASTIDTQKYIDDMGKTIENMAERTKRHLSIIDMKNKYIAELEQNLRPCL